jgi:ABC-type xylose transport system permease subunit
MYLAAIYHAPCSQIQYAMTGCPPPAMQNCKTSSCNTEELQMLLVIVMAVIAFAWSTFDSILNENAFQLLLNAPTMLIAGLGLTCTTVRAQQQRSSQTGQLL